MEISDAIKVILAIASIKHVSLPVTSAIAVNTLTIYERHRGPRGLRYFDAFHIATAKIKALQRVTSDRNIIENQRALGKKAVDLKTQ